MPDLTDLQNVNISGRLYGAYQDEPSFKVDGLDGLTGLTELLQYIFDNLGNAGGVLVMHTIVQPNYTGTTFDIPLAVNGGKLPADDDKVFVFNNGVLDYPALDYTIVRNGLGVSDQIQFIQQRTNEDLLIRFIA